MIPGLLFHHPILHRLCKQSSDFLSFQWNELAIGVRPVELRAEIERMNSRIVLLQDEEVLLAQEQVVFGDDLPFHCGLRNAQLFSRRTNNGAGLQQNDPVLLGDVVRMNWNVVAWHSS